MSGKDGSEWKEIIRLITDSGELEQLFCFLRKKLSWNSSLFWIKKVRMCTKTQASRSGGMSWWYRIKASSSFVLYILEMEDHSRQRREVVEAILMGRVQGIWRELLEKVSLWLQVGKQVLSNGIRYSLMTLERNRRSTELLNQVVGGWTKEAQGK